MDDSSTSRKRWFARGAAAGLMLFSTCDALSCFYLSSGYSDLFGVTQNATVEAAGFPFEIWREGANYGSGWVIDFPFAALNLMFAGILIVTLGWLAASNSQRLSRVFVIPEAKLSRKRKRRMTFSVRGLMVATTIAAVFLGVTQMLGVSSWLLGTIYLAGPIVLILIAMAPVGLHWQQRIVILVLFAIVMLIGSVFVGNRLEMEFDRVLHGIYICWVPQSVIAAVAILIWNGLFPKRQLFSEAGL
jgi:hypothetical protein